MHHSTTEIQFLDTIVYTENNTLQTKLFIKPTDKKYLHFNSSHPFHIKKSIPYSQALRYWRIISDDNLLSTELSNLRSRFVSRGYPETLINTQLDRINNLTRNNTLTYKSKDHKVENFRKYLKGNIFLPLITTYYPSYFNKNTSNIRNILSTKWSSFLESDAKIRSVFGNTFPQIVFTRGRTFSNFLVSSTFKNGLDHIDITNIRILTVLLDTNISDTSIEPSTTSNTTSNVALDSN